MKKAKFSLWLKSALILISYSPSVWVAYTVLLGIAMTLGRLSLAFGIMVSVSALFVGVGIAKYADLKKTAEQPVALSWAIKKSLPLALLAASTITLFWFVFTLIANLLTGEYGKILLFFFNWELSPDLLNRTSTRELANWLYTYANATLIFTLLMLTSFASWFSYPLMLFKDFRYSAAITEGNYRVSRNQAAVYQMLGFIFAQAILCSSLTPLLTPVLFMLTANLMYASYQSFFEVSKPETQP